MIFGSTVAVVIPAYNEEGFVGPTIDSVPEYVDMIYPVDDASSDGTWDEITETARRINEVSETALGDGRVEPIRHDTNGGVGAAIKTGYARAIEDGCEVVAVMAGDGQMDPSFLSYLIKPVADGSVAYAKGNRLLREEDRIDMSRWRLFGNALLTMLTRISCGYWEMTDPQNGYTVISADVLTSIPFNELYDRYGFANDLLAMLNTHKYRIADVSHPAIYGEERSDIRYTSFVPTLSWLLFRRFIWRITQRYVVRGFHPVVPAYALATVTVPLGVGIGVYSLLGFHGSSLLGLLTGMTTLLLGSLALILAMWFDVDENKGMVDYHIPDGPRPETVAEMDPPIRQTALSDGRITVSKDGRTIQHEPKGPTSSDDDGMVRR